MYTVRHVFFSFSMHVIKLSELMYACSSADITSQLVENRRSFPQGLSIHLGDKPACNPPVTKKSDPVVKVLASDNR